MKQFDDMPKAFRKSKYIFVYLMVSLAIVNFIVFYVVVNLNSILLAFQEFIGYDENYVEQYVWSLGNFKSMFKEFALPNSTVGIAVRNTLKYFATNIFLMIPVSYFVSYLLFKQIRGYGVFRVVFFLPSIISAVVYVTVFKNIPHFFLQATEHYTYRAVNEEDLRWQFYVYMAFGVKAFTYFTYRTSILEDFSNSCVDAEESGKTYPVYDYAKTVNREMLNFDHVYLNFDWNGTMPILGTQSEQDYNMNFDGLNNPLSSIDALKGAQATQDALIGQFKDKAGYDGLVVVNFTDPAYGLKNTVSLEFKDASKVRVYKKGIAYDYQVLDNRFELELGVGEGVFMIPVA